MRQSLPTLNPSVFTPLARRLAAVWFADIVGYSKLSADDENAALRTVALFQRVTREEVERYGGRLVKFTGDGALAEFSSTDAAVRAAIAVSRTLAMAERGPAGPRLLRIGVHVGDVVTASDGDIYGDGVNTAARLQQDAAPGQVLVSEDVRRHLRQQPEFVFRPLGERALRGIRGRVRLYAVDLEEARTPVSRVSDPRSIAVLPFLDISPGRDNEYFSDGIAEELINTLTHVDGLRVVSRTSSFSFKGKDLTARDIAERLGVATILEGSVRKDGRRVRITPQLIDAEDGYHLWSETYESDLDDIFDVQEKISRSIVDALRVKLTDPMAEPIVRRPTSDLEAYNLYLRGRYHWNRHTGDDLRRSIECFEAAIGVDPDFALAQAGLADTYLTLGALYLAPRDAYPKARTAAKRALQLDEKLAEAHGSLAEVRMRYEWDWEAAEAGFRRALELDPGYAQGSRYFANYLRDMGRIDEAIDVVRRAQAIDPLSLPIRAAVAGIYYFARRYDEAIEECRRIDSEAPYFFQHLYYQGSAYEQKGMPDQAIETYRKMAAMSAIPAAVATLGCVYARSGRRAEAETVLAELEGRAEREYVPAYAFAALHAALGDLDRAFAEFDRAVTERSNWLTSLKVEPRFDALRGDARFVGLLRKVGLLDEVSVAPGHIPSPPTPMVGREAETAEVKTLMRRPDVRLVTLTGPGGTGKTRLALEVAHQLREEFPDGVFFVPLSAVREPDLAVLTIARALNLQESGSEAPLEVLVGHLSGKCLCLVLDGFEQVVAAATEVARMLESTSAVHMLVTSREPLSIRGEHEYPVPTLALPDRETGLGLQELQGYDAVDLFVQRAQAVKPAFRLSLENAAAVAEICRRLNGLPLAIELAAARVKLITPQVILRRLADRFAFLTAGPRDVPERQQTLRGAFDWSYELLSAEEQALFRHVSVFVNGFTLDAAERVARPGNEDEFHLLDGLASLVNKSLLRQSEGADGDPRFEMLETVREYGLLLLRETGELEPVRQRHAEYCLELAERAEPRLEGPDQALWFDRLEAEHGNVTGALDWLLARGQVEAAVRLGSALWWFWWVRGHFTEMRVKLEQALARSGSLPRALQANLLVASGALISMDGDHERAARLFEEAVTLERERRDQTNVPRALRGFGLTIARRGEYARAATLFAEALSLDRGSGNNHGASADLRAMAKMELYQGNGERARELCAEALALDRQHGDRHSLAFSLATLAAAIQASGDLDQAVELYGEALDLAREVGSKPGIAYALHDLAESERERGNLEEAAALYGDALRLLEELGNRRRIADCLAGIAALAVLQGSPERATSLYGAVEVLRESVGWSLPPPERARYESDRSAARAVLGDAAFEGAFLAGRDLGPEQAIHQARQILASDT